MHAVVRVLVDANSENHAVAEARDAALSLLSGYPTTHDFEGGFTYFVPMENDRPGRGTNRWTQYAGDRLAFLADSARGQTELEAAWDDTTEAIRGQEAVKEQLQEWIEIGKVTHDSDIELVENANPSAMLSNYRLFDAATGEQDDVHVVSTPADYSNVVANLSGAWVVPMYAHY